MKYFLLIILLTFLPPVSAFGVDPVPNKVSLKLATKHPRPQEPSAVVVDCVYFYDVVHFCFPEHVEFAQVDIKDAAGSLIDSELVYTDNPTMEVSLTEGEYEITCRTDGNQIFSGVIYIQ